MNNIYFGMSPVATDEADTSPQPVRSQQTPQPPEFATCLCCMHPQRYILERRISREVSSSSSEEAILSEEFLEDMALEFGIGPEEILHHADFHMSVKPGQQSFEIKTNLIEASALTDALYDGMATVDYLGRIIRNQSPEHLTRVLSKEIVDLYTNAQRAVRDHVDLLAKLDSQINGTKDTTSSSLDALTAVIAASQQAALEQQNKSDQGSEADLTTESP